MIRNVLYLSVLWEERAGVYIPRSGVVPGTAAHSRNVEAKAQRGGSLGARLQQAETQSGVAAGPCHGWRGVSNRKNLCGEGAGWETRTSIVRLVPCAAASVSLLHVPLLKS